VFTGPLYAARVRALRLDDDGAPDLCVVRTPLCVLRNDGAGSFAAPALYLAGPDLRDVAAADLDGDGRLDLAVASGSFERLDVLVNRGACGVGTSFCSGDGSATACPCGNTGASERGCDNSFATGGAMLAATGLARVASDSVRLELHGAPPSTLALFLQSESAENGGAGTVFGDGLLCVGTNALRRLRAKQTAAGTAELGSGVAGDPLVSVVGHLPAAGGSRTYQAYYRNSASFCTPAAFNTSNGLALVWGP
jgi:hypothetical protein